MVAKGVGDERDVCAPLHNLVGSAQVIGPQEGLTAQFDTRREEGEHRDKDGHLQQHGQTAAHGVGTGQAVQFHGLLLLLDGIFLIGIFLVDLCDIGGQEAHLGLRDVSLVGQRREHDLEDDGQHQDDETVVAHEFAQPVKDGNDDTCVDPTEELPAQRDEVGELQVLLGRELVVAREHVVAVRAHVEIERGRLRLIARVRYHRVDVDVLEVVFIVG